MPAEKGDLLTMIQRYRQLVEAYEALDEEIDELVTAARGNTAEMSAPDLRRYRNLARQRNELLNDMRQLEQDLDLTDDAPSAE